MESSEFESLHIPPAAKRQRFWDTMASVVEIAGEFVHNFQQRCGVCPSRQLSGRREWKFTAPFLPRNTTYTTYYTAVLLVVLNIHKGLIAVTMIPFCELQNNRGKMACMVMKNGTWKVVSPWLFTLCRAAKRVKKCSNKTSFDSGPIKNTFSFTTDLE